MMAGIVTKPWRCMKSDWFENDKTAPNVLVCNDPKLIAAGREAQLEAAVQASL
jgi:hypothetical protein